jgi:hypothetical protein
VLTKTLKQAMETAMETVLMAAEPGVSIDQLAERMYDSNPALIEEIKRPLAIERFRWMINRQRQHIPSKDQLLFPGFPTLPLRVTLKNGKWLFLMRANLEQLKQYRQVLLKRKGTRLKVVERLIAVMEPYAAKRANISVAEVGAKEFGLQS